MFPYLFLMLTVQVAFAAVGDYCDSMMAKCVDECGKFCMLSCNSELDCPSEYSCHRSICKKCLKCDLLFRKGSSCTVDFSDCGDCLDGYEEISLTDHSAVTKPCRPVKKKVKLKECTSDMSCPPNNYCNEDTCVKCFDCGLINRLPPEENCAKDLTECGTCMKGFDEVSITTDNNTKPCDITTTFSLNETPTSIEVLFSGIGPVFILLATVIVVVCVGLSRYKEPTLKKTISRLPLHPSAPPLYAMDAPPQIVRLHEEEELSFITCVKEQTQQAKVYKQPDAPYYTLGEESNTDEPPISDQSLENHENTFLSAVPPDRSQTEESEACLEEILSHRLVELRVNEFPPTLQQANEVSNPSEQSSVVVDMVDLARVDENSDNEPKEASENDNLEADQV